MSGRQRPIVHVGLWGASLAVFGVIASLALTQSWAQEGGGDEPAAEEPAGGYSLPQRTRSPFSPYPADPGALAYESLADGPIPHMELDPDEPIDEATYAIIANETKASVDEAQAWAESHNGYAVSQAWSHYSAKRRAEAKVKRAEYEAGLAGMDELGVQ